MQRVGHTARGANARADLPSPPEKIVQRNVRDLKAVFNGAIRALARARVF